MSFHKKFQEIDYLNASDAEKIKQLKNIILDLINEMEAEDQNMHPEINHNVASKLQVATDALRRIEAGMKHMKTEEICKKIMNDRVMQESSGHSPEIDDINDICHVPQNKK